MHALHSTSHFFSHRHHTLGVFRLQRFEFGKSQDVNSAALGHEQQEQFCESQGGRLPTRDELCPNYDQNVASVPALGCENDRSWVPYAGNTNNWVYIGCEGMDHWNEYTIV